MSTPDLSTHLMLDDVNLSVLEAHDAPAFAAAGYTDGIYANWTQLVQHFQGTNMHLLSITVFADGGASGAQCLDIETGDATIAQAPAWFRATQAAGMAANDLRYYPKLYTSASNVEALISQMSESGIARNEYLIWSAHYTGVAHICSPGGCGYPQADATQYTDVFAGASLDASMCFGYFFAGPPSPSPSPSPPPVVPMTAYDPPAPLSATPYAQVSLGWAASDNASATTMYHVQVADMNGNVVFDTRVAGTSVHGVSLKAAARYQFRVAAGADSSHLASGWSPWYGPILT